MAWGEEVGCIFLPAPLPQINFYAMPCLLLSLELSGQLRITPDVLSYLNSH